MWPPPFCSLMLKSAFPAREATVRKIETIIRQQFSLEMKNKDHEIDVISQVFVSCQTPIFFTDFLQTTYLHKSLQGLRSTD